MTKPEIALMLMSGGRWVSKEMNYGAYAFFDESLLVSNESPYRYFTTIEIVEFNLWEDTEWIKCDD